MWPKWSFFFSIRFATNGVNYKCELLIIEKTPVIQAYFKVGQIWNNVSPDFLEVDLVAAILRMRAQRAGPIAFVVIMWSLLRGKSESPKSCPLEQRLRGTHFDGAR